MSSKRENPGFMLFANDVLHWEPFMFMTDAQLGQAFKLIVYGCKFGSSIPSNHPLLGVVDEKVLELCTRREGDHVLVISPLDLPRLMENREKWRKSRKAGAKAAGHGPDGRFRGRG